MNDTKYFSTDQVSRELKIELSRLKKIAYLVEKLLKKKEYYHRNDKNQRLYTPDQINEIERIIEIKRKNKVSYSVAIFMECNRNGNEIKEKISVENDKYKWFENMEQCMLNQEKTLKKLAISVESLVILESQNHKRMEQMNEEITEILQSVQLYRMRNKKNRFKKVEVGLSQYKTQKKVLMRKKDFKELKSKINYLPSVWNDRKKRVEMSLLDKEYYTSYVKQAKNKYAAAEKEKVNIGKYYVVSNDTKESLFWYGQFYDYLHDL